MLTLFVVCVFQFHKVLSQFPDHVDFQKEGEVYVKGEKYNVLKLSKHVVKDHFLNFMQRRDDDPAKRVFLDKNGLRHYWSGLNDDKNLRKSEGDVSTLKKDFDKILTGNIRDDLVNNEPKKEDNINVQDNKAKYKDEGPKDEVDSKVGDKRKPKRKPKPDVVDKVIMKPALRTNEAGKTLAITYFYCPFFGVMSLSAFID